MKIKIKTKAQLVKEGWNISFHDAVLSSRSNDKGAPRISHRVMCYLGETVEVYGVDEYRHPTFKCTDSKGYYIGVPYYAVDGQIPNKYKVKDKRVKKTVKSDTGIYFKELDKFKFPCGWANLNTKESVQVANWILKVTKK